jgi:hypothetical protein
MKCFYKFLILNRASLVGRQKPNNIKGFAPKGASGSFLFFSKIFGSAGASRKKIPQYSHIFHFYQRK